MWLNEQCYHTLQIFLPLRRPTVTTTTACFFGWIDAENHLKTSNLSEPTAKKVDSKWMFPLWIYLMGLKSTETEQKQRTDVESDLQFCSVFVGQCSGLVQWRQDLAHCGSQCSFPSFSLIRIFWLCTYQTGSWNVNWYYPCVAIF